MDNETESKEMVSFKELLLSNVYTQEALINLLDRKGILTKKEVLEEIKKLQSEHKSSEK